MDTIPHSPNTGFTSKWRGFKYVSSSDPNTGYYNGKYYTIVLPGKKWISESHIDSYFKKNEHVIK